jgi:hypothetical protein
MILECKDRMGSSWCIREMEEQIAQLPAVLDLLKKAGENAPKQLIDDVNWIKTGWLKMAAVLVEVNIVEILRRREKILQYDNLGLSSDFKNECVWRLMAQFPKLEALLKKAEATHQAKKSHVFFSVPKERQLGGQVRSVRQCLHCL